MFVFLLLLFFHIKNKKLSTKITHSVTLENHFEKKRNKLHSKHNRYTNKKINNNIINFH